MAAPVIGIGWEPLLGNTPPTKPVVINVKRPHLADGGDAFIEWGQASTFTILTQQDLTQPFESGQGTFPPDPPQPPGQPPSPPPPNPNNPGVVIYHWTELGRTVSVIRVENPDDSTQFVDIERVESILFAAPDGSYQQFDFHNPGDENGNDPGGYGNDPINGH